MYGKQHESLYTGSMIGSGAVMFAVWGYVLTHRRRNLVELNVELLAFLLGEPQGEVQAAIDRLCAPDPRSRSKAQDGRRLIKEGEYVYCVVNADRYDKIQSEYERRERDKIRKREERGAQTNEEGSTKNNGAVKWDSAAIYNLYPRKVGKPRALAAISKAIDKFGAERILEATKQFAEAWKGSVDFTFCPHPATWYGQHRFNDDPATWARNDAKPPPEHKQIQEEIDVPSI